VNIGEVVLALSAKLQVAHYHQLWSHCRDEPFGIVSMMHLQYNAHVALTGHPGQTSNPRKHLQALGSRGFLKKDVKLHIFHSEASTHPHEAPEPLCLHRTCVAALISEAT
jgi:hypothetical protein